MDALPRRRDSNLAHRRSDPSGDRSDRLCSVGTAETSPWRTCRRRRISGIPRRPTRTIEMTRHMRWLRAVRAERRSLSSSEPSARSLGPTTNEDQVPFDVANVFAELNDTDGDLGFHALIDGDAWKNARDRGSERAPDAVASGRHDAWRGRDSPSCSSRAPSRHSMSSRRRSSSSGSRRANIEISGRTIDGEERESTGGVHARACRRRPQYQGQRRAGAGGL